jgi:cob(I)alamin adenosyltransferase
MEHTDWLADGLNPAEACFLMLTAITHHEFSSPMWGEREVRKLHAELTELDQHVAQVAADHAADHEVARTTWRRAGVRLSP